MSFFIRIGCGLAVLAATAATSVFALSEAKLRRSYDPRPLALAIDPATADVAAGEHDARIYGCADCHGADLKGRVLFEQPHVGRLVAPDVAAVASSYTDEELVRLIRFGVKRDGTSLVAMPAPQLNALAEREVSEIVAFVRSLPVTEGGTLTASEWGPLGRIGVLTGDVHLTAAEVTPVVPPRDRPAGGAPLGRHLVATICSHCHQLAEPREDGFMGTVPALQPMVASYDREDFRRLMRTGIAAGERDLGLMSDVARASFAHMTDGEIDALYAYLGGEGGGESPLAAAPADLSAASGG
jgi:mono/diheme cytochrome c family protein